MRSTSCHRPWFSASWQVMLMHHVVLDDRAWVDQRTATLKRANVEGPAQVRK